MTADSSDLMTGGGNGRLIGEGGGGGQRGGGGGASGHEPSKHLPQMLCHLNPAQITSENREKRREEKKRGVGRRGEKEKRMAERHNL